MHLVCLEFCKRQWLHFLFFIFKTLCKLRSVNMVGVFSMQACIDL